MAYVGFILCLHEVHVMCEFCGAYVLLIQLSDKLHKGFAHVYKSYRMLPRVLAL